MLQFKDHFSLGSEAYATYRPSYPAALFACLADLAPDKNSAWDCATGTGQAALALTAHFDRVIATDASRAQLKRAVKHERIAYRQAAAEESSLPNASQDLVTVGQALHWFDLDRFYAEIRRVLKPRVLIAAWCYNLLRITPELDEVIDRLYAEIVGEFWPVERRHVETGYRDLPFPFESISVPSFAMEAEWTRAHLLGYLGTWSAVKRYKTAHGIDPIEEIRPQLERRWPQQGLCKRVYWPLNVLAGRVESR